MRLSSDLNIETMLKNKIIDVCLSIEGTFCAWKRQIG